MSLAVATGLPAGTLSGCSEFTAALDRRGTTTKESAAALAEVGAGTSPIAGISAAPNGLGAWIVRQDGQVIAEDGAPDDGDRPSSDQVPAYPVVSLVPTSDSGGYWLIGADGAICPFGDASSRAPCPASG